MSKERYIGAIDVDDKNFNVALINENTGELIHFKSNSTVGSIIKKLKTKGIAIEAVRICYEATYLGFSLYRDLEGKGIKCEVIAPSLIPRKPGDKIKTDRRDCISLAEYYLKGMLTAVKVPEKEDEMARDLIRSRRLLVDQLKETKNHIVSLCKRMGFDYRKDRGTQDASYWTKIHYKWLEEAKKQLPDKSPLKTNLSILLCSLEKLEQSIFCYTEEIKLIAEQPEYKEQVKALNCYRGLDTLSSLGIVTELGDIGRFPHPENLTSYIGLSISEYSSGGKENRFGITKQGNRIVRTILTEACQFASRQPRVSKKLKERRAGANEESIKIADRCMHRLNKKSYRMSINGKHRNKIKTACAREMLCFIWETLNKAA